MIFNLLFRSLTWAALILTGSAQDPTRSADETVQTHSIAVGKVSSWHEASSDDRSVDAAAPREKGNHQFVPDTVVAQVGDIIEFQFFPPNHSVVRAESGIPCIPYELTGENKVGFFSGFNFVERIMDNPPTYNLLINDTEPIFFYCSAPGSCINWGMVGVINPASVSSAEQQAMAKKSTYMLNPGEPLPTSEDGSSPSTPTPSSAVGSRAKTLSSGAIAGITVAGVVAAGLIGACLFLLGRNSKILSGMRKDPFANVPSHPMYGSGMLGPYSPNPMSDYDPYAPLSPYGVPVPQSPPPVELSSPQPDQIKHTSLQSDATAYDDARWQMITPPPIQHGAIHSELDASHHAQSSNVRHTQVTPEDRFR